MIQRPSGVEAPRLLKRNLSRLDYCSCCVLVVLLVVCWLCVGCCVGCCVDCCVDCCSVHTC